MHTFQIDSFFCHIGIAKVLVNQFIPEFAHAAQTLFPFGSQSMALSTSRAEPRFRWHKIIHENRIVFCFLSDGAPMYIISGTFLSKEA